MTADDVAARYQQRPAPAGGGEIRAERFDPQNPPQFIRTIQSWDTAATDGDRSDYSPCLTIGETKDKHFYLLDCCRGAAALPCPQAQGARAR